MIEIISEINFNGKFNTVRDIRDYLAVIEQFGVQDDTAVLDGYVHIVYRGNVEPIECGDHHPSYPQYDFLITTHAHEVSEDQETTEEI